MEYKTVEGDEIVRDGEYETRDGRKVVVNGFVDNNDGVDLVQGYVVGIKNKAADWFSEGQLTMAPHDYDLMRPWQDKPDAEGWIKWEPGFEIPLLDTSVIVEYRDGKREIEMRVGEFAMGCWRWNKDSPFPDSDIVAYRIVKEPSPEVKVYKLSEM